MPFWRNSGLNHCSALWQMVPLAEDEALIMRMRNGGLATEPPIQAAPMTEAQPLEENGVAAKDV